MASENVLSGVKYKDTSAPNLGFCLPIAVIIFPETDLDVMDKIAAASWGSMFSNMAAADFGAVPDIICASCASRSSSIVCI